MRRPQIITLAILPSAVTHSRTVAARPPVAMVCSWDEWGDRLVTKCHDPAPNADRTGCATCGARKLTAA